MSNTAGTQVLGAAPWKARFLEHVNNKMDAPEFVLATLHKAPAGAPTPYIPQARFCIFRGMWGELPANKHNDAPKNEATFESELPTFTTDVRMLKVADLFASSPGHAKHESQMQGSGGGGLVEAVFWVKEESIQWRIKGEAYVVGPDIEGDGDESSGVRTVKSELGKRMRIVKPESEKDWSWQKEITAHFANLSPSMKGSFKNPPPGQDKSKPYDDKHEKLGEKLDGNDDEVARKNFRVVVIRPEFVEELSLNPDTAGRKKYSFNQETSVWDMVETWQ